MHSRTIAAVGLAIMLGGCWGPEVALEVSCAEFASEPVTSREVRLAPGGTLEVALCSNPSTGNDWTDPVIADPKIVEQLDREYRSPEGGAPGAPGLEVWTFRAARRGSTTVRFAYGRPWIAGEESWVLTLDVVVE
jgi:predicted secreted protein